MTMTDVEVFKRYHQKHRAERNAHSTIYYMQHSAHVLGVSKEYYQVLKREVLTRYSDGDLPGCVRCGESDMDVLCIDHINDDGYKQRKDNPNLCGSGLYKWLRRNHYPEGFQVLCANCNLKKRMMRLRES